MTDLERLLASAVIEAGRWSEIDEFKVLVDDPDRDTWSVGVRWYCDADRAGYSGYRVDEVADGLGQQDAVALAAALNEARGKR